MSPDSLELWFVIRVDRAKLSARESGTRLGFLVLAGGKNIPLIMTSTVGE